MWFVAVRAWPAKSAATDEKSIALVIAFAIGLLPLWLPSPSSKSGSKCKSETSIACIFIVVRVEELVFLVSRYRVDEHLNHARAIDVMIQVDRRRWSITTRVVLGSTIEDRRFVSSPDDRPPLWGYTTLLGGHACQRSTSIGVAASRGHGWDHVSGHASGKKFW
jgi:hypothetical protein